jgi:hypothetical protein
MSKGFDPPADRKATGPELVEAILILREEPGERVSDENATLLHAPNEVRDLNSYVHPPPKNKRTA